MSIQQQVVLRYRAAGHLRFQLPAGAIPAETTERLAARLRSADGIYRVDWYARQGKLSIRFIESIADFAAVVRLLHSLLAELLRPGGGAETGRRNSAGTSAARTAGRPQWADWVADKKEAAGETLTALKLMTRAGIGAASAGMRHRPRWMTDFMNDVLMLYLIKVHWHAITQLWLPNPWRYRYEWAATFYVIFLQVQSRLPKPA